MRPVASYLIFFILFATCYSIFGQKTDLSYFNKIDVSTEIDIELILDKSCGIEWILENIDPEKIITEIQDQTLRIRTKIGLYKNAVIKAKVYYTDLIALTTTGRASVWSEEELYPEKISFILNNGGETRLIVHADTLIVSLSEGSIIYLKGETKVLDVKVGTGATFSGYDLESEDATVLSNSWGKAKIAVNRSLNATATSYGFIGYIGEPENLVKEATLGGEIIQTFKE